jgi:hypothetical protein
MSSNPDREPQHSSYVCPPDDTSEAYRLGWVAEATSEGLAYLNTQPGFSQLDRAIDIISGQLNEQLPGNSAAGGAMSKIRANIVKRALNEQISVLTDLRDFWMFETSDKTRWEHQTTILNNLTNDWYHNTFVDLSIKEALQYAAALGKGYLSPFWKSNARRRGVGDIALQSYGARDVLPIQLPSNHNLQEAYAVIIKDELPITVAWRQWPHLQHRITADRDLPTTATDRGQSIWAKTGRTLMDFIGLPKNREDEETPFPTVDVNYIYIDDFSINTSGFTKPMGQPGTSFYYEVPSLGSDVPAGRTTTGQTTYRKAERSDCQLYPNRRLIICTKTCIIYDGPSYWWHGQVPLISFSMDEWVWNFLGFSLVLEVASISDSFNEHLRNIDDSASVRLDPPMLWDKNAISATDAQRFSTRRRGMKMRYDNFKNENPIKFPVPPQMYDVPPWIISEYVPFLKNLIGDMLGVPDLKSLAKAKQVPGGDAIEKLMEMAGPIVRGMSRSMERSLRGLGQQVGPMFFQFYDTQRRIWVMGQDGITEQDFDFDPGSIIPANEQGFVQTRMERARTHMHNFNFRITPGSLHQLNQTSRKLLYLQLMRSGYPIDPETVSTALDIPNWGHLQGNTVLEKWGQWKDLEATIADQMAQAAQGAGQGKGGGRKPSGQNLPQVKSKDGGSRTTVSESR